MVGSGTSDDSSVYRLNDDIALVQSVDFFPPIVDDPYSFGAIAAANSLSDIYAMGATPLIGLNIVCFPIDLPKEILTKILKGGADKMTEAGAIIAGGHTIDDTEPKYGISVTGLVKPGEHIANIGAEAGDSLVLTKPLGTGIITTARKANQGDATMEERAIEVMRTLNKSAAQAMIATGVNACTDITGFGLLGHLKEMVKGSNVTAQISLAKIPIINGVSELAKEGIAPGGTKRNFDSLKDDVIWDSEIPYYSQLVLADAQTSGGLLISVSGAKTNELMTSLEHHGVKGAKVIGKVQEEPKGIIYVCQ